MRYGTIVLRYFGIIYTYIRYIKRVAFYIKNKVLVSMLFNLYIKRINLEVKTSL